MIITGVFFIWHISLTYNVACRLYGTKYYDRSVQHWTLFTASHPPNLDDSRADR